MEKKLDHNEHDVIINLRNNNRNNLLHELNISFTLELKHNLTFKLERL